MILAILYAFYTNRLVHNNFILKHLRCEVLTTNMGVQDFEVCTPENELEYESHQSPK
jgi:hypothetical protein